MTSSWALSSDGLAWDGAGANRKLAQATRKTNSSIVIFILWIATGIEHLFRLQDMPLKQNVGAKVQVVPFFR